MTQVMLKAESSYMYGVLDPTVIITHAKLAIAPAGIVGLFYLKIKFA